MESSSYLKSQKRQKEQEKKLLLSRTQGLERMITGIENQLNDFISGINSRISFCVSELGAGVKGSRKSGSIQADMTGEKEKYAVSDSKISECRSNLNRELFRCQNRMNTLESEIAVLSTQIRQAEAAEAEEKRRALEAAVKALAGGI